MYYLLCAVYFFLFINYESHNEQIKVSVQLKGVIYYDVDITCNLSTVIFNAFYIVFSGSKCTNVLSRNEVHEVTIKEPCVEKYNARCGWLSLNYCTFYR